jgi:O-antigen ligase
VIDVGPTDFGAGLGGPSAPTLLICAEALPEIEARRTAVLARLSRAADNAALVLLILALAALLVRPADLVPALEGAPIYETCMACCFVAALPRLLGLMREGMLRSNAIMALVLLLTPAVVLSHLAHADTWDARVGGIEAAKVSLLFLLVVVLATTPGRLRAILLAVAGGVLVVTILALLNRHGVLHLASLSSVAQRGADEGGPAMLLRLQATGIFNDPNDYALMLVACMGVCVHVLTEPRAGRRRWMAFVPLALFGYALVLTQSRGGLLSAAAAAGAYALAKSRSRSAIPALALLSLVLLAPFWGRQTTLNLSDPEDTFQSRLELWSASLETFRNSPVFGIGQGKLAEAIGQVSHNSFLHAFAETGLLGGGLFIGAFFLSIRALRQASPADPELARLKPCVLAIVVGCAAGLLTLSRCYTAPTQLVLGLGMAYLMLVARSGGGDVPRMDWPCLRRLAGVSAAFLLGAYLCVRVMLNHGAA